MNQPSDCTTFRSLLELALGGPGSAAELQPLAWHEHLLGCEACRELLTREEALEALLATLPEPGLPAELRERVLLRLKGARDDSALDRLLALDRIEPQPDLHLEVAAGARERAALEGLLDLDPQPTAPAGLAERVAAAARARADAELDHLLELDPDPVPPPDLPALVISATAAARRPALRRLRLVQAAPRYLAAAAAVLLLLGVSWWQLRPLAPGSSGPEVGGELAGLESEPDPELLAALDLLTEDSVWDDEVSADLDLLLADEFDPEVEALLAFLPPEPEDRDR